MARAHQKQSYSPPMYEISPKRGMPCVGPLGTNAEDWKSMRILGTTKKQATGWMEEARQPTQKAATARNTHTHPVLGMWVKVESSLQHNGWTWTVKYMDFYRVGLSAKVLWWYLSYAGSSHPKQRNNSTAPLMEQQSSCVQASSLPLEIGRIMDVWRSSYSKAEEIYYNTPREKSALLARSSRFVQATQAYGHWLNGLHMW